MLYAKGRSLRPYGFKQEDFPRFRKILSSIATTIKVFEKPNSFMKFRRVPCQEHVCEISLKLDK